MKSFTTFFSAAVGLRAAFANAALSDPLSVLPASSVAINSTSTALASTTTVPTVPTTTGGFTIVGVYTTCLTVTFNAPTTTATLSPSSSFTLDSSLPVGTTTPVVTSFTGSEVIIPTGSVSGSVSTLPTGTVTVTPDVAVFTTCLVFLPTATVTGTVVPPIGSVSASAPATTFDSSSAAPTLTT
ncbi:hypothetical protein C8F04DRAFT_1399651 [Mycena alexandri]|uniref:Uncharacterized protein n=1 Tax=Mycena alexandri TaxID=1745969 RepID=A0AAD6SK92_9AGAR|nr:hypothetical protein C8F04DRAFT_1399651 [Mycena alexandri]